MAIKKENIEYLIESIDKFNSTPGVGTTRVLFTKEEVACREFLKDEMRKLGLEIVEDGIGNVFATLKGTGEDLAPVWSGSHMDTVLNAGKFDGMAGIVCAIEAAREIKESGIEHKRDIVVVIYTSEEPTRFTLGCLGSRALAGELSLEETKELHDNDGKSLYEVLVSLGFDTENFADIKKKDTDVYAAVELHIEQNNRLELSGNSIGIVSKICAPSNYTINVKGRQSHAGGTDMERRRDAFAATAEMAMLLEDLAKKCSSEYNTATIGKIDVFPGSENVIPGDVTFTVDVRDCNMDTKDKLVTEFQEGFGKIAERRGVSIDIIKTNHDAPITCDQSIVKEIESSCDENGFTHESMISGPFHDSLFVGRFTKIGMLFVPSKDGISHSKEEFSSYEDLAMGTKVLTDVLVKLSNEK